MPRNQPFFKSSSSKQDGAARQNCPSLQAKALLLSHGSLGDQQLGRG